MSGRSEDRFRSIVEVVLLAAEGPVALDELVGLFAAESEASVQELRDEVRRALGQLAGECADRGVELRQVAGGFRYQVRGEYARWVARFLGERPARYSRALLETLALIAYRQPITRGEIEEVRGVGVSASIMRTLHEREWIRVLSHRDAPGRPALYGTTGKFLDDFGLRSLEELHPLDRIRDVTPADLFPAGGMGGNDANGTQEPGPPEGGGTGGRAAGGGASRGAEPGEGAREGVREGAAADRGGGGEEAGCREAEAARGEGGADGAGASPRGPAAHGRGPAGGSSGLRAPRETAGGGEERGGPRGPEPA